MQRPLTLLLLVCFFIQPAAAQTKNQADATSNQAAVEWIKAHAVRLKTTEAGHGFADMKPLKKIIGNARIVSLGEATHGTREFFQLKHRMLEFLASEMGFTIFSIEANMPEAYRLNDYVLNGNGDPAKLLKGMYFWTWDTQEVLDMIKWMREFNKSGKGRVQFTGFDMQTPDVAMGIVDDFVAKNDRAFMDDLRKAAAQAKTARRVEGPPFGVATASFPVEIAAGKRIHYSGYIKTQGISRDWAGLWWRVDGKSGVLAFDNMQNRGATGTTDWKRYEIDIQVPKDATNINFGAIHSGDGSAWFDGLSVTIDGEPYREKTKFDLDFESPAPVGFFTGGGGYQIKLDKKFAQSGKQSLLMRYAPPPPLPTGGGVASASFPAGTTVGKRVRLSGYIKTRDVSQGFAGLWLRVDGPSGVLAFDNMEDRGVTGTTDWARYEVELPVATGATNIIYGALFPANGTGWFDSLKLEVDGALYPGGDKVDLDFESSTPMGFHTTYGGDAYQVQIDTDVFHTGKQSLRIKYVAPDSATSEPVDPKQAGSSWKAVVRHLEESRSLYAKRGVADRDLDWAIQNARVVVQSIQLRTNEVSRDQSMADNVKWILDHNPGAKIVLWAHNGHVASSDIVGYKPMGASLREMFPGQMVVFGFAFNQGSFQAVERGKTLRDFTVAPAPAGSLDATLAATGIPIFAIDLRKIPRTAETWLSEPHKSRNIGSMFAEDMENQFLVNVPAAKSFDALLFVERTTAARKNGNN